MGPRQCKSISVKTLMALKQQIFSPANLSLSMVGVNRQFREHLATG